MNEHAGVMEAVDGEGGGESVKHGMTRSFSIVRPPAPPEEDQDPEEGTGEENTDEQEEKPARAVRYTEIRSKFPALLAGGKRELFPRQDSTESQYLEQVRGFMEGEDSRAGSSEPGLLSSHSCESLEQLPSLPASPDKAAQMAGHRLEVVETEVRPASQAAVTPVVGLDPLGALSTTASPLLTPAKENTVSSECLVNRYS